MNSGTVVTPAFQPAGRETFQSRVPRPASLGRHRPVGRNGRLENLPTCRHECRRDVVTPAFQPASRETFQSRVDGIAMPLRQPGRPPDEGRRDACPTTSESAQRNETLLAYWF